MFRSGLAMAAALLWAVTASAEQQPPATGALSNGKLESSATKVVDGIYVLEGMGGNITVATAKDGVILVDGGLASSHDRVRSAIAAIGQHKVKFLIDTHFHGDHTGGNEYFARNGATVIADVRVRNRMATGTSNGLTGVRTPPAPTGALPAKTFNGSFRIKLDNRTADLNHIANAYTDGDTFVWFKTANVLATGDTFVNGRYPDIDYANGGNIDGMIAAADTYLRLTDTKSKIVPGHGPIADKTDLLDFYTMLVVARDRMDTLIQDGKSENDVLMERPFADLDVKWAPTEAASKNFIRVLYRSMTDKPAPQAPQAKKPQLLRQVLHN
jgi:glyoxylase-like metal-dependent hydrolase (beta-lactamase superfamily II)